MQTLMLRRPICKHFFHCRMCHTHAVRWLNCGWSNWNVYRSECLPLQACQRGGWVLFWVVQDITTKERPCHAYRNYRDSMLSKQIIGQSIICNGTTSSFEVRRQVLMAQNTPKWHHVTVSMVELAVHIPLATSVYPQMPSVKYYITFLTSDMPSTWSCASQTLHQASSRVGAQSSKLWPYSGPK